MDGFWVEIWSYGGHGWKAWWVVLSFCTLLLFRVLTTLLFSYLYSFRDLAAFATGFI